MSEKRREPEVPEEKVPVGECLEGPARITSKELAPVHSVKSGILQNACSTSPSKSVGRFGEKCSYAHRQVDEAVPMLKKYDLHDRTWQHVVNRDKGHDRTGQPVVKRDTRHELNHGPVGCR